MAEYAFTYDGFALDATNGVYIDTLSVKPTQKVASASPEGRDGLYIGKAYRGETVVTMSGMLIGTSATDLFSKQAALTAALSTRDPSVLTWRDTHEWLEAACSGLPDYVHTTQTVSACRVSMMFLCQPDETAVP